MRKFSVALLSGVMAVSLGLAAACSADETDDDDKETTTSPTDTQTILNGNFEFFNDSEENTHIIYTPDNWSSATSGQANYSMNGIIDTSAGGWKTMSAEDLASRLEANYELDEDDDDYEDLYVDYNGMRARDIPYADPHSALDDDSEDSDKALIANPMTHDVITEGADGTATYTDENGETVTLYSDDEGNYFTDEELTEPYESHVLMVHNYRNTDYRYGTAQSYSSASTITLEPNTAAEISVWVKTSDLMYNRNGETPEEGLGAYIAVEQTVGDTSIDEFVIEAINTAGVTANNGWVQYTVFVQGCDFASSTVTVELGLGRADDDGDYSGVLEGYAFFDDVACTLYSDISDSENFVAAQEAGYLRDEGADTDTVCTIADKDEEKIFVYDMFKTLPDFAEGDGRNFYIDLAGSNARNNATIGADTVSATLTADADKYVTSSSTPEFINVGKGDNGNVHMNHGLDISTANDVIASFSVGKLAETLAGSSAAGASRYATLIQDAFKNADTLPGADENSTALVLLSSRGAAYTAEISGADGSFTVPAGEHMIVSMWVKTSDMDGYSAATMKIYDADDDDISAALTADTTGVSFDVGEEEDIYDGWVQCFFLVDNPLEEDKTFKIDFGFGNTSINGTTSAAYKAGWAAVTNIQTFDVEKDVFDLATTGTYSASFSFSSTDNRENGFMDTVYGALNNNIESNISRPSSYNGAYGASASVVYKEEIDPEGYDGRNNNENAGLINKDYFWDYIENAQLNSGTYLWLEQLLASRGMELSSITAAENAAEVWNEIFGTETVQPLLIVNTVKVFAESNAAAMNYGFLASKAQTVAASGYQAISVKVKASAGAAAYVYLTEDGDRTAISSFTLPSYSFWYDSRGNVLDSRPDYDDDSYDARDHVVYYLRNDGLYEDGEGKLFANMYNYSRQYYDDSVEYYEAGTGEQVTFENLDPDTVYYTSSSDAVNGSGIQAPHYLVADDGGNTTRVFRYVDGDYLYMIYETDDDGNTVLSYSEPVENFVIGSENGGADLRYDNTGSDRQLYSVIDARYDAEGNLFGGATPETADVSKLGYDAEGNYIADKWQTITFYIHAGDKSINYSLELWSGAREASGVTAEGDTYKVNNDGSVPGSYVMFDHSNTTASEDNFGTLTQSYASDIIKQYVELFRSNGLLAEGAIDSSEENIAYYESKFDEFVESGDLTEDMRPADYSALYYTYSLYDDTGYVPFNGDTAADGETGYVYTSGDYEETLVYLSVNDKANNAVNVFADYSATDVTVEKGSATEDDDEEEEHDHSDETNVWLLTASIILAVALLFTLVSIFVRDLLKKRRAKKNFVKNVYAGKRKHYIRKLGLTESVVDENEAPAEGGEANEAPEAPEAPEADPEENAQAEDENTADEATEAPADAASDTPDENKPEGENN